MLIYTLLINDYFVQFNAEAVYFGKPMIGIPICFDQGMNTEIAKQNGFAISVPIENLTADKISMAVRNVLSEPRYEKDSYKR